MAPYDGWSCSFGIANNNNLSGYAAVLCEGNSNNRSKGLKDEEILDYNNIQMGTDKYH